MRLRAKILWVFTIISLIVSLIIISIVPVTIHDYSLETATTESMTQLGHIDFALSMMIGEIRHSVQNLSENRVVRNPGDANFTNFLNASSETFVYNISSEEQAIIDIFRSYGGAHAFVNSVYMGRENGAFVRAYPRDSPTEYDPRERPWYVLGKQNPGQIMITAPYKSVTNDDVNIGVVTALVGEGGSVYGVVGIDITLASLTDHLSGVPSVWGGEVVITDDDGVILVARNISMVYTDITALLHDHVDGYLSSSSGRIALQDHYMVYRTSDATGWKLSTLIPAQEIRQFTTGIVLQVILFAIFALVLLSVMVIVVLDRTVVKPIADLTRVTLEVAQTGRLDQDIQIRAGGEIGSLARSFKGMLEKLRQDDVERRRALVQIERNLERLAALNDQIRNPLSVIMAVMTMEEEGRTKERVVKAVKDIDGIVTKLDRGWEESAKVRRYLIKHGHIEREAEDEEDLDRR